MRLVAGYGSSSACSRLLCYNSGIHDVPTSIASMNGPHITSIIWSVHCGSAKRPFSINVYDMNAYTYLHMHHCIPLIAKSLPPALLASAAIAGFRAFGTSVGTALLFNLNIMPMVVGIATCFFLASTLTSFATICEPVYHALEESALWLYTERTARASTKAAAIAEQERKDGSADDFAVDESVSIGVREASSVQVGRTVPTLRVASMRQVSDLERPSDQRHLRAGLSELSAPAMGRKAANGSASPAQAGTAKLGGGAHADVDVPLWVRMLSRYPLRLLYLGLVAFTAIVLPFVGDFMVSGRSVGLLLVLSCPRSYSTSACTQLEGMHNVQGMAAAVVPFTPCADHSTSYTHVYPGLVRAKQLHR